MAAAAFVCMMLAAPAAVPPSGAQGGEVSSRESDSQRANLLCFCNEGVFPDLQLKCQIPLEVFDLCSVTVQLSSLLAFLKSCKTLLFITQLQ